MRKRGSIGTDAMLVVAMAMGSVAIESGFRVHPRHRNTKKLPLRVLFVPDRNSNMPNKVVVGRLLRSSLIIAPVEARITTSPGGTRYELMNANETGLGLEFGVQVYSSACDRRPRARA